MSLPQMKLAREARISVMKMAMDTSEAGVTDLLQVLEANTKMMEQSVNPHIGGSVDIKL